MKHIIRRLFTELYHWQNDNWGKDNLPAYTSLLILSGLQMLNFACFLLAFDNITSLGLAEFLYSNIVIGMVIPAGLLLMNYLMVRPVSETIKDNPLKGRRITWIYVLATLLLLVLCVAWTVNVVESR